jgi:hypothetical protein
MNVKIAKVWSTAHKEGYGIFRDSRIINLRVERTQHCEVVNWAAAGSPRPSFHRRFRLGNPSWVPNK